MVLIPCPECLQQISHEATTCPKCGKPIPSGYGQNTAEAQNKFSIGCGAAILVIVVATGWFFSGREEDPADKAARLERDRKTLLYVACQDAVRARLRSPSTADFPGPFTESSDEAVRMLADSSYRVASYVDAQNAFGGTVRTSYSCTFKRSSEGRWQLQEVVM